MAVNRWLVVQANLPQSRPRDEVGDLVYQRAIGLSDRIVPMRRRVAAYSFTRW